ncbi:glucose-6-phosphate isomerase [Alphaproteobacteria bacterium]|nr:glucose-6-phosphate isomerase [Alphaproteobacteria bacterium]
MLFSQSFFNLHYFESELKSKVYLSTKKKIFKDISSKSFGFLKDIYCDNLGEITKLADHLRNFENVLFLGTGGSSLGGKTLVSIKENFFFKDSSPKIFFLENVDEWSISRLIMKINLQNTALVVISKSGETIETLSQFFFLKNEMREIDNFKKKVFIITENKKSTLKEIQEEEGFKFYEHKKNIGGRFSIFSLVGLLPASLAGFEISSFREGGKLFLKNLIDDESFFDNQFFSTLCLMNLYKKNYNISVFMPYSDRLDNLSFWYRQLWAESIGKNRMGITPVNALGTVDQHSQLQLYLDGPSDKFFTFIFEKKKKFNKKLDCSYGEDKNFSLLHNRPFENLLIFELRATIETLKQKKAPLRVIELDEINENAIGSLIMFLFLETIFSCYFIDVDPFNQPAVEEGKILTKEFLENE